MWCVCVCVYVWDVEGSTKWTNIDMLHTLNPLHKHENIYKQRMGGGGGGGGEGG